MSTEQFNARTKAETVARIALEFPEELTGLAILSALNTAYQAGWEARGAVDAQYQAHVQSAIDKLMEPR